MNEEKEIMEIAEEEVTDKSTASEIPEEISEESAPEAENSNEDYVRELEAKAEALEAENKRLKNQIFCQSEGIPPELADDIICAASVRSSGGDISFEDAAREIFGRISSYGEHGRKISTGVRSRREGNGDDLLRKAFGLK